MPTQHLNSNCSWGLTESRFQDRRQALQKLGIAFLLAIGFIGVELWGAQVSGSLALFADAIHMLGDAAALGFALLAGVLSTQSSSHHRSFGFFRLEVIAALFNSIILIAMAIFIATEAINRWNRPIEILAGPLLWIASIGLLINLLMLKILHSRHAHNINLKAAFLHVVGDTLSSIAVIVGAVLIYTLDLKIADLIASLVVSTIIGLMAFRLAIESLRILIEAAPSHLDFENLKKDIFSCSSSIEDVSDVHVWEISSNLLALTCRIQLDTPRIDDAQEILQSIRSLLDQRYGIGHCTIEPTMRKRTNDLASAKYQP
jgi:cobalt-zinc-cadmium efflux system protein